MKKHSPIAGNVWMNGVKIGLNTERRLAFGDVRLLAAQALNLGRVTLSGPTGTLHDRDQNAAINSLMSGAGTAHERRAA